MKAKWTTQNIPDLSGRVAVVTGASGGLGVETCRALAAAGARVVLACRNTSKGEAAAVAIREDWPDAQLEVAELELGSLASIRAFAERFEHDHEQLDLLINNAGIIGMPLQRTEDGFEMQMGVDCLGHFALTGLLLPQLRQSEAARVVSVGTSSQPHRFGRIDPDDLNWETRRYNKLGATLQAKLAFQMWAFELNERLAAQPDNHIISLVAHPGIASTNISTAAAEVEQANVRRMLLSLFAKTSNQSAWKGALPTLYAATSPAANGGDFIGPDAPFEMHGYPRHLKAGAMLRDRKLAAALWSKAEELTGVHHLSEA